MVQASPYAAVYGVPLTVFGVAGYAGLVLSAFMTGRRGAVASLAMVILGIVLAAYCMWQELIVIGALCQLCAVCAGVMASCFVVAVVRLRVVPAK